MASPVLSLRATRVAIVWATLLSLGLCSNPLTGIHGVESALFLGLLLPPFVAAIGASLVHALRDGRVEKAGAMEALGAGVLATFLVVGAPVLLLGLDQLRFRQCTPLEGLAFMALGPLAGGLLAMATGLLTGALIPRRRLAIAVAAMLPILSALHGLYSFWSTPAIFVFDHFAGLFPGTIYDEDVALSATFVSFRWVGASLAFGLVSLFFAGWDADEAAFRPIRLRRHPIALTLSLLAFVAFGVATAEGASLGHRATADSIAELLGGRDEGRRCVVHHPREMATAEVRRLVEDCDLRVEMAEAALGVAQAEPLRLFLYRSADEKRRAMGAGGTNIAKPWRDEVHLQHRPWPHPVLFHEVVHVVAGNGAQPPFRVAMSAGLIPNPGLIEGLAVAVAWNVDHDLSPHQWARAMRELELLPPLDSLMNVGFLRRSGGRAYIASGSFIRFLMDTRGAEFVMEAYAAGTVETDGGPSRGELEGEWLAFLDALDMPSRTLALARMRFSQPGIFSRVCPHRVAALRRALAGDIAAGDAAAILATCDELLEIDEADLGARVARIGALEERGREGEAVRELEELEAVFDAPAPVLVTTRMRLADSAWSAGRRAEAEATYRSLLSEPQTDDAARQIEVRLLGLESGGEASRRIRDLLIRGGGPAITPAVATHLGARIGDLRPDGLGPYLVGRQLHAQRRFEMAAEMLEQASERGLPTARLRIENERLLVGALVATGALEDATERLDALGPSAPLWTHDWRARIAHQIPGRATEPEPEPEPDLEPEPEADPPPPPPRLP